MALRGYQNDDLQSILLFEAFLNPGPLCRMSDLRGMGFDNSPALGRTGTSVMHPTFRDLIPVVSRGRLRHSSGRLLLRLRDGHCGPLPLLDICRPVRPPLLHSSIRTFQPYSCSPTPFVLGNLAGYGLFFYSQSGLLDSSAPQAREIFGDAVRVPHAPYTKHARNACSAAAHSPALRFMVTNTLTVASYGQKLFIHNELELL